MAFLTAAGVAVVDGELALPLVGRPVAQLDLEPADKAFKQGDPVELAFSDGTTFQMAVLRAGLERGAYRLRLVAGAGGLGKPVAPKFYSANVAAATVFRDVLTEVGEAPGAVDLPGGFPFWVRAAGPAFEALQTLMLQWGDRAWRVKRDGAVWAGLEAWPAGPKVQVVSSRALAGAHVLQIAPELEPGQELAEVGRVVRVVHRIARHQTEVWTA